MTGTGDTGLPRRPNARRRLSIVLDSVSGPVPALFAAWLSALALTSALSPVLAVVIGIGFLGAFVAGLVGIGGAIILIPMLLYGPHLVGHVGLDIHTASGVTMVQVAVAGVSGMLAHRRLGNIDVPLTVTLGGSMAFGSLVGGLTSGLLPDRYLSAIFASLAAVAAGLMLAGPRATMEARDEPVAFNAPAAAAI
ncbi:MAG TPA: sulfite exporter TauE/SafE family protein, partial [Phycisphaerae bacterium]|nr:sulfite exporter TauE/SafE family protein [Phycisphaerae bacterium]